MRAVLLRDGDIVVEGSSFELKDDRAHHLIKVVRVKKAEEVLILDGQGTIYCSQVEAVSKRSVILSILSKKYTEAEHEITLLLGMPKREAFELSLKNSIELGIKKVIPFESTFSNWTIKNTSRLESIVESAVIQSNNPYKPIITDVKKVEEIKSLVGDYDLVFTASVNNCGKVDKISKKQKILLVVGPEGGLSQEEEGYFLGLGEKSQSIHLPTPILRTPNAVSACLGYIMAKFE